MWINIAVVFVISTVVACLSTPFIIKTAKQFNIIDVPNYRKVHKNPIPRLGGLAIYFGFVVAILIFSTLVFDFCFNSEIIGLLTGGTCILILGIIDDAKQLPAKFKLLGQILSASILIFFDIQIDCVTNPFGELIYLNYFAVPFTILWIVSMINIINLIDGLDGLAAGVSIIASITILVVALQNNLYLVAILSAALAGSALGFLQYNFSPAKIFMGDAGSMFLGYLLSAISLIGAVKSVATIALIVPIVALGLPIIDTIFAIVRRYNNGNPIFTPDRGHLHHRLLDMGLTQRQAVLLMYAISVCLGVSAILVTEVTMRVAAIIIFILLVCIFFGAKKIGILNNTNINSKNKN